MIKTWKDLYDVKKVIAYRYDKNNWYELIVPTKETEDEIRVDHYDINYINTSKKYVLGMYMSGFWGEKKEELLKKENLNYTIFDSLEDFQEKTDIDQDIIGYCSVCGEHFIADEDCLLLLDEEIVCPNCYSTTLLDLEKKEPNYIFTGKDFTEEYIKKALYVHFDYEIILEGFKKLGWKLVASDWSGTMDGYNFENVVSRFKDYIQLEKRYLIILDRSTYNCCSLGINLLEYEVI